MTAEIVPPQEPDVRAAADPRDFLEPSPQPALGPRRVARGTLDPTRVALRGRRGDLTVQVPLAKPVEPGGRTIEISPGSKE